MFWFSLSKYPEVTFMLLKSIDQLFCRTFFSLGLFAVFSWLDWDIFLARIPQKWCCILLSASWDSRCQYVFISDVYLCHLVKMVSAGFLYWKGIIFLWLINILGEILWEEAKPVSQTCPLILASVSESYLQQLLLCFLPNGESLFFSFLLAVSSSPFMYLSNNLYHCALMNVFYFMGYNSTQIVPALTIRNSFILASMFFI